jgi:hypothetical protein
MAQRDGLESGAAAIMVARHVTSVAHPHVFSKGKIAAQKPFLAIFSGLSLWMAGLSCGQR